MIYFGNALSPSEVTGLLLDVCRVRYDLSNEKHNFKPSHIGTMARHVGSYYFGSKL